MPRCQAWPRFPRLHLAWYTGRPAVHSPASVGYVMICGMISYHNLPTLGNASLSSLLRSTCHHNSDSRSHTPIDSVDLRRQAMLGQLRTAEGAHMVVMDGVSFRDMIGGLDFKIWLNPRTASLPNESLCESA
ncbi:hypothetical protein BDV93DRAFT_42205 [Ceratobasidium sp. AG-I]|nr:hypothetical protein BDV93DRAFT_42205 [Ceratobasidium sp. AG-I]